jgi:hypothetical protein
MTRRKKLLRREDVKTLADKLRYSQQQRELWEHASISDYNDFSKLPPIEHEWEHPEFFSAWADAERKKRKLQELLNEKPSKNGTSA